MNILHSKLNKNLDNGSSVFNSTSQTFDDDSVNFEIVTRTSSDAFGTYTLTLAFQDTFDNRTLTTTIFTWSVSLNPTPISNTPDVILKNLPEDPANMPWAHLSIKLLPKIWS